MTWSMRMPTPLPVTFYYSARSLGGLSMAKYDAHERALIRELKESNQRLKEQNLKLEDIKDILVMMLDKRQFEEYQEMLNSMEGVE